VTCVGARIPNWLTYGSVVAALAARALLGWPGIKGGLIGLLAGGGVFFLLFALGGMGGGDVKLMAAVGTWAGGAQTVVVLLQPPLPADFWQWATWFSTTVCA